MTILTYKNVEEKILTIRNNQVILDSDVAELYGVETKRINEAVKNNYEKFPEGYLLELTKEEWDALKSKFSTSIKGGKVKTPVAFTERGLYMLATILKSPTATQTTLLIIDTFAKVRELGRAIEIVQTLPENSPKQKTLVAQTGDLIADLLIPDDGLNITDTETTVEMNFIGFKIKRTIKKSKQGGKNHE